LPIALNSSSTKYKSSNLLDLNELKITAGIFKNGGELK